MIQIYRPGNTVFDRNGDMALLPESATVHAVLNGEWEVKMVHPIDEDGRWKYIEDESVIKMTSFNGEQLFRIKSKVKTESIIEATAVPIFLDARDDCFLDDIRPTNKNGQQALNLMTAPNSKYRGESDIKSTSTAYYQYMNLIEAINGTDTNSFINRWGGEILYDNYKVTVNTRVGADYGVKILYGRNIRPDGIEEEVDFREVVTRIYPKSYNGYMMSNHGYVDSSLIDKYPNVKTRTITFEDVKMREDAQKEDEANGITVCDTQAELDTALRKKCQEQFELGLDKPSVNLSIDIAMLQNTEEYQYYADLEKIFLGDTVHCSHYRLGIETTARAVELEWDCIRETVTGVVIGDFTYNYFKEVESKIDRVDKAIRPDGSIVAEEIKGIINAINASLQLQSTAAKKVDGRAFLIEDLDPESKLFGAMESGTQGFRIAKKRSPDNRDWMWTTAITAFGIIADAIMTGKLSDKTGQSYWDMDTGEMVLSGVFQQFNRRNGYKSVDILNNRINFYSWQNSGDYIGSIGSLANKSNPESRQTLGIYADTTDKIGIGYISGKGNDGENIITDLMTFDPTKLGENGYIDRAIKFKEIPEIPGTITLPVTIGTTTINFFNGLITNIKYGKTFDGKFKSGADETVKVVNGVIESIT